MNENNLFSRPSPVRKLIAAAACSCLFFGCTSPSSPKEHSVSSVEDSSVSPDHSSSVQDSQDSLSKTEQSETDDRSTLSSGAPGPKQTIAPNGIRIGELDMVPAAAYQQGWIACQNGKAGLLGTNGQWKIAPSYDSVTLIFNADDPLNQTLNTILFVDSTETNPALNVTPDSISPVEPGGLGGYNPYNYCLNDQNEIVLYTLGTNEVSMSGSQEFDSQLPEQTVTVYTQNDFEQAAQGEHQPDQFFLWCPPTGQVFGPYSSDARPAYGIHSQKPISLYNTLNSNAPVNGPFFVIESDGSYTVYSADGSARKSGYERAVPCSVNAISVIKDGICQVLDGNLKTLCTVQADAASVPIDGKVPLEADGQWYLSDLSDS